MKKSRIATLVALSMVACMSLNAQSDSVRIETTVSVGRVDPVKWIERYNGDIERYIDLNRQMADRSCDVLFIGSSSINMWPDIEVDFAPLKVIRRSYGGSAIRDMIYNYNVIARGYSPRNIVLYCENDLMGSDTDLTPGDAYDLFRVFISMLRRDYPGVPVYVLPLKPSFARQNMLCEQRILNSLLEDYAAATPDVEYVDITVPMYGDDGMLRGDIFLDDKLHMNRRGYDLWLSLLGPLLKGTASMP